MASVHFRRRSWKATLCGMLGWRYMTSGDWAKVTCKHCLWRYQR